MIGVRNYIKDIGRDRNLGPIHYSKFSQGIFCISKAGGAGKQLGLSESVHFLKSNNPSLKHCQIESRIVNTHTMVTPWKAQDGGQ